MTREFTYAELPEVAAELLETIASKTLLFYGDMGVGKTALIKALAAQLGAQDPLSSPTFSIVNEYALPNDMLYHFDFYRLENEMEALDIGLEEYLDSGHWNMIEWPQKINNLLPGDADSIQLIKNKNGTRTIALMPMMQQH